MSEKDLQRGVIEMAHLYNWMVFHPLPAQNSRGDWRTFVQGDKGYPDLTLVSEAGLLFVELKSAKGRLSPEQKQWIAKLGLHADVVVWKPQEWQDGTIEAYLSQKRVI